MSGFGCGVQGSAETHNPTLLFRRPAAITARHTRLCRDLLELCRLGGRLRVQEGAKETSLRSPEGAFGAAALSHHSKITMCWPSASGACMACCLCHLGAWVSVSFAFSVPVCTSSCCSGLCSFFVHGIESGWFVTHRLAHGPALVMSGRNVRLSDRSLHHVQRLPVWSKVHGFMLQSRVQALGFRAVETN